MKILYATTMVCLVASLSGCGGSVSGGGGGGPIGGGPIGGGPIGGPSNLTESEISALPLTASVPSSGTANYAGRATLRTIGPIMESDGIEVVGDFNMRATFTGGAGSLSGGAGVLSTTLTNLVSPTTAGPFVFSDFTDNGTGMSAGNQFFTPLTGSVNSVPTNVVLNGFFRGGNAEAVYGNDAGATFFGNRQ